MSSKNRALVVASETQVNLEKYRSKYFIVGVERGALALIKKKIPIDLAIGDFDKVTDEELKFIKNYSRETLIFDSRKDYLDGELAIIELRKRHINWIKFVSEANERYDKNISICELVWKYKIYFFNKSTIIFRIDSGKHIINYEKYKNFEYVSFFANKPSIVTINNFKYNAKNLKLMPFENRAISNQFIPNVNGEIITDHNLIAILSR